jgi:hypothetical protein
VEASWYGDSPTQVALGGSFHSGRLSVRASQVGTVAHPRRTHAERMRLALDLLHDPAFDVLLTGESRFEDLPEVMARLVAGDLPPLCHTVVYDQEEPPCSP